MLYQQMCYALRDNRGRNVKGKPKICFPKVVQLTTLAKRIEEWQRQENKAKQTNKSLIKYPSDFLKKKKKKATSDETKAIIKIHPS